MTNADEYAGCRLFTSPCPDFLYMILVKPEHAARSPTFERLKGPAGYKKLLESVQQASKPESTIAPHAPCASCGRAVASRTRTFGVLGGYRCQHCGYIHVYGALTLRPRIPSRERDPGTSTASPQEKACPCGSGKVFSECHGSE
ncbi:MAG: SEC-C domain-containing protein [Polyangiaceae bacterium]|nr:SEC-C domain-containing protein [Polyangiaceae bacterium]